MLGRQQPTTAAEGRPGEGRSQSRRPHRQRVRELAKSGSPSGRKRPLLQLALPGLEDERQQFQDDTEAGCGANWTTCAATWTMSRSTSSSATPYTRCAFSRWRFTCRPKV
ncbi:MAG: hypothetical protein IPM76_03205 [Chloroflexi bacterium]|nr:hypothetical protein [Chloroflexota bacterium]